MFKSILFDLCELLVKLIYGIIIQTFQQNLALYNKYLSYINLSFNIICQNFCKESTAQYYPHLKKFSDNFVPVSCPHFTGRRCIARRKIQNYANK